MGNLVTKGTLSRAMRGKVVGRAGTAMELRQEQRRRREFSGGI